MRFTRLTSSALVLGLSLATILSGCGSNDNNGGTNGGANVGTNGGSNAAPSEQPASASPATTAGSEPAANEAKYDPPITVNVVRSLDAGLKFENGETLENNAWIKAYADELGIDLKYSWITDSGDLYNQKLNVTIASGELPDIMAVNAIQLKQLADAGQLEDLTATLDQYGSPMTKQYLNGDGGISLKSGTFDGKLLGLPRMPGPTDGGNLLWVRTDWLEKLNLPEPKTMDDVFAIAQAFKDKDPDGNGKNDTYGLALEKTLYGGAPGLTGFFNSYHAYPGMWVKDASGQLAFGSIQPEMKPALAKLADMYKAGLLDKEFGAKDSAKVGEALAGGKAGLFFGLMWAPLNPLINGKKLTPDMEWKPYPLPSIDDKPASPGIKVSVATYYVVRKGMEHPEALVKMMNVYNEKSMLTDPAEIETFNTKGDIEKWKYAFIYQNSPTQNADAYVAVNEALKTKDTSKLLPTQKTNYDAIVSYNSGDVNGWGFERVFGPEGSQKVLHDYIDSNGFTNSEFYGAPTPSMADKNATLATLEIEAFTKIIMGAAPPDSFDEFVANWKKLGGDQITQEVNDWKNSQ